MEIVLNIPDDVASQMGLEGMGLERTMLEALALEGYRSERLSEGDVRELLGLATRMEVHAFLKEHGVYLQYSVTELEEDRATASQMRDKRRLELRVPDRVAG